MCLVNEKQLFPINDKYYNSLFVQLNNLKYCVIYYANLESSLLSWAA
jgi:hypothetical protein